MRDVDGFEEKIPSFLMLRQPISQIFVCFRKVIMKIHGH
uniref:Uncharacterized protein n=1 Tax=Populus trichocarpa TaxID=3694 RepID=A0A3N7GE90_POPTR